MDGVKVWELTLLNIFLESNKMNAELEISVVIICGWFNWSKPTAFKKGTICRYVMIIERHLV